MKEVLYTILLSAAITSVIKAQEVSIFPKGEKSPNVHHVGNVWLNELSQADSVFSYSTALATFDAGARLDWHLHPGGQILMVTQGVGYYQEKGKPKQTVRRGDVIKCLPDIPHWHGATPGSSFAYIATSPVQKGKTKWLQKVTNEEYQGGSSPVDAGADDEKEIKRISREKWLWMSEKKVDTLTALFHDKAVFVHMGGTMTKAQELDVIKTGAIHYKQADIQETSVQLIDNTAILLNKLRLVAVVGGKEVTNPFVVTEVYVKENEAWKLGSMSFTRLLTP
jgi:4-carboxymuconolactone decarboxylase